MPTIFFVHTGGFNEDGSGPGPVTIARTEAPWKRWRKDDYFVITAGSPAPASGTPICELVRVWLIDHGIPEQYILTPENPRADNSIAEVIDAVALIQEKGLQGELLYVSSTWEHITPRIWVIWRKYGKGLKPKFILAERDFSFNTMYHELKGTIAVILGETGPRYVMEQTSNEIRDTIIQAYRDSKLWWYYGGTSSHPGSDVIIPQLPLPNPGTPLKAAEVFEALELPLDKLAEIFKGDPPPAFFSETNLAAAEGSNLRAYQNLGECILEDSRGWSTLARITQRTIMLMHLRELRNPRATSIATFHPDGSWIEHGNE